MKKRTQIYYLYIRYGNVTLSPQFSFREYFNFLFAYVVMTYYSLQFLSNGDTK